MTKYIVTGGVPLHGTVTLHGAKNAGFKAMIASLLADSPSTICDLGLISEIDFTRQVITELGGEVIKQKDPHCLTIDPRKLSRSTISRELGGKSRNSIYYIGPLLARFGSVEIPIPGGDINIARRPLDRHIAGLQALGAKVDFANGVYHFEAKEGLRGATFRFPKSTHNGTEVLILAAAKAKGTTILENAAQEPEVDDLIKFLNLMGVKITRTVPRTIKIVGVDHLEGAKHIVMKDRNEAVTFACAALATKGEVKVVGADSRTLGIFLEKIREIGGIGEIRDDGILFRFEKLLSATNVETAPYPGFMTDWQPLWTTLMTQAEGVSTVHETIYERRFDYVPELVKMGANIELFPPQVSDPDKVYSFNLEDDSPDNKHAIRINGPTPLSGRRIEINDVRSGATALLAGVTAKGQTTVIDSKDQIKRGYERLEEQLVSLGANIKAISDV